MDGQRTRACSRSEPIAHELAFESQRAAGALFVRRPLALRVERAMGDADGREIQNCAELEREPRPARVAAARGVDQEDIRPLRKGTGGCFQQGAFAQRKQPRLVRGASLALYGNRVAADIRGRPCFVAGLARTALAAGKADEDAADPHAARATFFVLARMVEGREETLRRTVAERHEVGNHTWSHHRPRELSDDELRHELARTSARIEEVAGMRPRLARPPYGADEERFARVAAGLGLRTVLWTVNPRDWLEPPADWLARAILRYARPGAIVDLHDGFTPRRPNAPRQATVEAVRLALPQLAERGFRLVTVAELTDPLVAAAREAGVEDERVLAAIAAVPRAEFVPAERADQANVDTPIPIPHEQVTTQPSLVARMVEALALAGDERVLEIGTGYGWQTAL